MKGVQSKILCIGEVLWDCLPCVEKIGGAPMNVAIHLKKFGLDVSMFSKVGNDKKGEDLIKFIEESGLNTSYIQKDGTLPTSEVLVKLDRNGNASYNILKPVAWDNLEYDIQIEKKAKKADIIVFGTLASREKNTFDTVLKIINSKALKILDINLRLPFDKKAIVELLMHKADIIKLNAEELFKVAEYHNFPSTSPEGIVHWMTSYYKCQMICVTMGANGAILYSEGNFYSHEGFKVKVADTVGAGDAFLAGFIYKYLKHAKPEEILSFACATGALVASKAGATPVFDLFEIENLVSDI
jgi:fructokinase